MNLFNAPIPGESLTAEPGNYPWERPMMHSDPEKAIQYHIKRMSKPKTMDAILTMLQLGMPVRAMTESMLTVATMNGIHDPDISLVIGPVLHEQIKQMANYAGIEYEEGFGEPKEQVEMEEKELLKALVRKEMKKQKNVPAETKEFVAQSLEELDMPETEPMIAEQEPQQEEPKKGLMARRTM